MKIIDKIDRYLGEGTEDIKAEHEGVLSVPSDKKVTELGVEHFVERAKKVGRGKVVKALMNLYRWNKNNNQELSSWAKDMQEKVSAALDKDKKKKVNEAMVSVDDIMAWENGEMDAKAEKTFFQKLIDTGMAYQLQGMYGRRAQELIKAGVCKAKK
jgi:hypothetical protein